LLGGIVFGGVWGMYLGVLTKYERILILLLEVRFVELGAVHKDSPLSLAWCGIQIKKEGGGAKHDFTRFLPNWNRIEQDFSKFGFFMG
jgi:hypothetical protein